MIKKDAEYFSIENITTRTRSGEPAQTDNCCKGIANLVAEYNQKTFLELKHRQCIEVIEEVDSAAFNEFTLRINKYLDENAPGQEDLKRYVRMVSTYLTFIVKQPLHPPGMVFTGGHKIVYQDNTFYCPVKRKQLHSALSVCKYCVSRDVSAIFGLSIATL